MDQKVDVKIRYALIKSVAQTSLKHLTIRDMCHLAKVSKSGYYAWIKNEPARRLREERDRLDFLLIKEAYEYKGYDKGSRGIHMRLLRMGHRLHRK